MSKPPDPDPILVDLTVYHWDTVQQRYVPYTESNIDLVTILTLLAFFALGLVLVFVFPGS